MTSGGTAFNPVPPFRVRTAKTALQHCPSGTCASRRFTMECG